MLMHSKIKFVRRGDPHNLAVEVVEPRLASTVTLRSVA